MTALQQAIGRVGKSTFARARWLLGSLDTGSGEKLAPEQLDRLVWDWGVFLGMGKDELPLETDLARDFQSRAYKAIKGLAYGKDGGNIRITLSYRLKLSESLCVLVEPDVSNKCRLELALVSLLRQVKDHLRRCAGDGCQKIFIRVGRQRYCSKTCAQRDRTKRFRMKGGAAATTAFRLPLV